MKKRNVLVAATALALAAAVPTARATTDGESKNIVQTAVAAGNFTTLAKALEAAGLIDALSAKGPFTVFAPTDAAFAKLPAGTVEDLLKPENRTRLQEILKYHVVSGEVSAAEARKLSSAKTLAGETLTLSTEGETVKVGAAKVVKADVEASNGVIHAIDTVVMPPEG